MARKDGFYLEWHGLDELIEELEGMEREFEKNIQQGMKKYSTLAEEGTRALAPRDSGDLESSMTLKIPYIEGSKIVGGIGSNLAYALRRHEEPYRYGIHDKYDNGVKFPNYYVYGKGRRTLQKPSWRGEKPGRKYLERAIVATEKDFVKIMADALEQTLRGRRY
ncbi:HK97 gp10 family phage protein [Lederbergia galactosidilytica]|uniref:HK97 gp10 family phage protein n=1 Tax=Lederbergia galactosidilytica TaxID=217031 RepID=A0A177ZQS3_9BACI|nr:HK97 gp10 family phage protein [Lederbergia galactosidilytica]OAK70094.1 hypothetical protein ABB05_13010 [Lederbergia galactosidilytica]